MFVLIFGVFGFGSSGLCPPAGAGGGGVGTIMAMGVENPWPSRRSIFQTPLANTPMAMAMWATMEMAIR